MIYNNNNNKIYIYIIQISIYICFPRQRLGNENGFNRKITNGSRVFDEREH